VLDEAGPGRVNGETETLDKEAWADSTRAGTCSAFGVVGATTLSGAKTVAVEGIVGGEAAPTRARRLGLRPEFGFEVESAAPRSATGNCASLSSSSTVSAFAGSSTAWAITWM